ncbi:MAG TPA: cytochrome c oxidase accessory protein CcoG [Gammaproteobacteria bacterium]|nr:cytochrome c oxidase accessory protein CcoG [Gammaproteobacteria bacterium]HRP87726.1 cytochrome c oxidase accessory protein CcoG [Gammaproteobacteria bacterium]
MNAQPQGGAGGAAPESFYVAHEKIYPREVKGRYATLRNLAVWVLLGIYYLLPWIPWGDRQAVLFDLPARKFYIFGLTFWPQDFFFMAWLLIIAALTLFFVTAIAGRLWCGYACPQTVWTEAFLWMERLAEGNHSQRRKLDKGPWTREKVLRKGAKQVMWIGFALWTGFTFVAYFTPATELGAKLLTFSAGPWETFWVLFYGFATYGNAGLLREQVCKYMCPYARFQSAMFDKDTMIISYDARRGEPRGGRKRSIDPKAAGLGDCIDCNMCVQVCPTGIDIREGLQIECIACAACVDVCNDVMDKMAYPRGLIRYSTHHAMEERQPARVLRPRVMIYGALLLTLLVGFGVAVANRSTLIVDVIRDRNMLYRELPGGLVENVYTVTFVNKTEAERSYRVTARGLEGLEVKVDAPLPLAAAPGEVRRVPLRLQVPVRAVPAGGAEVTLVVEALGEAPATVERATRFIGPADPP